MKLDPSLRKVASALFTSLNTPVALSQLIKLRYEEWDQLATSWVDPRNYMDSPWGANAYFRDSQACNFLRKSPLLPLSGDRVEAAKNTFHECEALCKQTNDLIQILSLREISLDASPLESEMNRILRSARNILTRVLGRVPDSLDGKFGPGTCAELKGSVYSTIVDKLWVTPKTTPACSDVFEHFFWSTHWGRTRMALGLPLPGTIRGNRFTTVPKQANKDRGICIEPLGNLYLQLGIGSYLKRRAVAVGLHIGKNNPDVCRFTTLKSRSPDGQVKHQELALLGSLTGSWATIDLSNASDTVALELIRRVLPMDWFDLLVACRSPYTLLDGSWHRLEKFSSMGNGFTFELESLVFAALVAAGTGLKLGTDVFAYGDDIIVPSAHASDAMAIVKAFGFQPNEKKSFIDGPFRESCGGDFFSGFAVRSCYADSKLETPLDWMVLHNQLKARGLTIPAQRCVQQIPTRFRLFGPHRLGDRVLHGPYKPRESKRGYQVVAVLVPTAERVPLDRWGHQFTMTSALLGLRNRRSGPSWVMPKAPPRGFRIRLASVS